MKAAVYHGRQDLRVEDIPIREIKDDEALIQVKYCGVCGTDVHIYNGDGGSAEVTPPLVPGHEFSGVIAAVGDKVEGFKIGDRVCADPNIMCGECYFCRNGKQHFCKNHIAVGVTLDGAFAEYVTIKSKQVYKVSDKLSFLEAAMAEPLACCLHGIDLCDIQVGDTVFVIGGGPIGMLMLQLAKNAGASKVILSEPVAKKRELALELGADIVINPLKQDLQTELKRHCVNVDKVIECVGNIKTISDAIECAGKGATIMLFGLASPDESLPVKPDDIFKKELKITSSFINPYTFERALKVLEAGRIDVTSFIANIIPLDELVDVFIDAEYRRDGKVMIEI